jgi:hypothetical protein
VGFVANKMSAMNVKPGKEFAEPATTKLGKAQGKGGGKRHPGKPSKHGGIPFKGAAANKKSPAKQGMFGRGVRGKKQLPANLVSASHMPFWVASSSRPTITTRTLADMEAISANAEVSVSGFDSKVVASQQGCASSVHDGGGSGAEGQLDPSVVVGASPGIAVWSPSAVCDQVASIELLDSSLDLQQYEDASVPVDMNDGQGLNDVNLDDLLQLLGPNHRSIFADGSFALDQPPPLQVESLVAPDRQEAMVMSQGLVHDAVPEIVDSLNGGGGDHAGVEVEGGFGIGSVGFDGNIPNLPMLLDSE